MLLDFAAYNFLLFITIVQSESQIFPREISDELQRCGRTVTFCDSSDKDLEIETVPCCKDERVSASGNITEGPEYFLIFLRQCVSCGLQ